MCVTCNKINGVLYKRKKGSTTAELLGCGLIHDFIPPFLKSCTKIWKDYAKSFQNDIKLEGSSTKQFKFLIWCHVEET